MRSPQERAVWTGVLVVLLAAAAAAWWTADQWLPHARPWSKQAWRSITRPPPPAGHAGTAIRRDAGKPGGGPAAQTAPQPRKCVQSGRTTYTDQACPPGSAEQFVEPALDVLPK